MMKRLPRLLAFSALLSIVVWGALVRAQTTETSARIVGPIRIAGPIREQFRTQLLGNVSAMVQPQYDRGKVAGPKQLTHIRIVLKRSVEQQTALDRFEQELQDKSSPNYHRWLTPQEFGKRYGPADSDLAAIVAWLQSHGLLVEPVSPGRTNIAFSGTVSQVEEAFDTSIHSYEFRGRQFYSNSTNPSIPSALAPLIQGIAHLNTWTPKPSSIRANPGKMDPSSRRLVPLRSTGESRQTPAFTSGGNNLYMVPGDAATIYDTPNAVLNANYSSTTRYDGTGVIIGIGGTSLIKTGTVQNYRSHFLGDSTAPIITNIDGAPPNGDDSEPYLDVEIAGGLAPGATIHYYVANDLISPIQRALTDNTVDIFSFSYDECERFSTTADNAAIANLWEQAAAQGIAVTVATGDSGSAACDDPTSNGQDTPNAVRGLAVSGYASTPYNIAVGGTDFDQLGQSFSSYSTSGGSAATYYRTALKYIPEAVWNDSSQFNNSLDDNQPWSAGISIYPANIIGTGGGPSNCSTNKTTNSAIGSCISGYSKPAWQRGAGVPADGVRDLPDISLMAGNGFYNATWLVCDDSTNDSTGLLNDCSVQSDGSFSFDAYGGTSTSAPAFAGILALVEQSAGGRLGQAATQLYNLYNGSHATQIFHDVTQGNNSVSCTQGSPNCSKDKAAYYFETGYNATAGYDLATGLGSVDAAQLISYWNTATSGITATVAVTPANPSITVNQSLSVAVTVAGSAGLLAPSGTVTVTGGGYTSPAATLSNGTYTFTVPANALSVGTDTLTVAYSGDTNYASATGSAAVTVTAVPPATFTLSATTPSSIAPGASATSTVTIQSSNGYTGAITLSCALTSAPAGASKLPTCSVAGSPASLNSVVTTGTAHVTVITTAPATGNLQPPAPDNSRWFSAAGGSAVLALLIFFVPGRTSKWRNMLGVCLLVAGIGFAAVGCGSSSPSGNGSNGGSSGSGGAPTRTTPTVKVSPASSSIVLNTPVSVAVTVTGSAANTPTGSITLASGSYASPVTALAAGATAITIPADTLPAGQDNLTASYSGDTNYNPATGKATLAVTNPPLVGGTTSGTYTFTVTGTGNDAAKTLATTSFTITVS